MGLVEEKKAMKRQRLMDSAYDLYKEKGISNTSIAEISARSHVAKGTFYLYFKDKEDITSALLLRLSRDLLNESFIHMKENDSHRLTDNLITIVDYIIEYLKQDKELLTIVRRDFVWPFQAGEFLKSKDPLIVEIKEDLSEYATLHNSTLHELVLHIYALISMVGSIAYASIIDNFPCSIDEYLPVIHNTIYRTLE